MVIAFCCAIPANAAEDLPVYGDLSEDDYIWTLYDSYTPAELVEYQPKNFYLDENGYAVHNVEKYGNTSFSVVGLYSKVLEPCKVVIDCTADWVHATRVNGKVVWTTFTNSGIYCGSVLMVQIKYSADYQIVFRGVSVYTGVKKTFLDRFPALQNALVWVLSNLAMVFSIITKNPVLCLGLALFAAGFAIYFYKRIRN